MNEPTSHGQEHPEPAGELTKGGQAAANTIQPVNDGDQPRPQASDPLTIAYYELLDLPRQLLPEQTYTHLQNARREAVLAVTSLFNGLSSWRKGSRTKVRRHIDVE